jgi:hypothetical protein
MMVDDSHGISDFLEKIGNELVEQEESNHGNHGKWRNTMRIESHSKPNKQGGRDYYWYWAERKRKTGKQGGRRWRTYGGTIGKDGHRNESTGKRGGARRRLASHDPDQSQARGSIELDISAH